jgi:hypothetical protein
MSATIAREGVRVQLEQSDMCLALNFAKMAKRGFSRTAIEETQHLIKKTRASVREETTSGVEFSGHNKVMAMIGRHLAMVRKKEMDGYLPCRHGTRNDPQKRSRRNDTGAPPLRWAPPRPVIPPLPTDDDEGSETDGVPPAYVNIHTPLPSS